MANAFQVPSDFSCRLRTGPEFDPVRDRSRNQFEVHLFGFFLFRLLLFRVLTLDAFVRYRLGSVHARPAIESMS